MEQRRGFEPIDEVQKQEYDLKPDVKYTTSEITKETVDSLELNSALFVDDPEKYRNTIAGELEVLGDYGVGMSPFLLGAMDRLRGEEEITGDDARQIQEEIVNLINELNKGELAA